MEREGMRTNNEAKLTIERPWGYYTVLHERKGYKVKEIGINPRKSLAMQKHSFRSEHWNVVEGTIKIIIGKEEMIIKKNESIFVPINTKHKVYNETDAMAKIIEVQIGSYVGEDDITRYEGY